MLLKSFLKSTIMGVRRDPSTTIIQVGGLVLALTAFLLIAIWVEQQLSFDRFNTRADRIYRVEISGEKYDGWVGQHSMFAIYMKEKIPEIENFVRFRKWGKGQAFQLAYEPNGDKPSRRIIKGDYFFADSSFFNVFSFNLLIGDPNTVLKNPNSIVLSDKTAQKLFGNENPVGKTVLSANESVITGVYQHVNNFHIGNDWIVSLASLTPLYRKALDADLDNWKMPDHPTYLLLSKGADPIYVKSKITEWMERLGKEQWADTDIDIAFHLRPLKEIYFNGNTKDEGYYCRHGNKNMVIAFIAIGMFVLVVACINFVNLSTAKSASRAREIGVRKVNGSSKRELITQFMIEIFIYSLLAFMISITVMQLLLSRFNNLIQGNLNMDLLNTLEFWIWSLLGLILLTFLAGFIPSYFYARLKPTSVLRDYSSDTRKSLLVRRIMLIGQYIVSTVLVIAVLVIFKQLSFMKEADPGFEKRDRLVFGFSGDFQTEKVEPIRQRLLAHPDIISITHCFGVPGNMLPYGPTLSINGEQVQLRRIHVDEDYFKTLGIELIAGRNFDHNNQGDLYNQGDLFGQQKNYNRIILNETAVKAFKLTNPIGAIGHGLDNQSKREVIGIVKDFHFSSLKEKIPPICFIFVKGSYTMIVQVNTNNLAAINQHIKETALHFFPEIEEDFKVSNTFLEESYNAQYKSEERLGELFVYFALLAVFIACLGLYGLSSYSISKRTREIAIRKANGALIPEIFIMMIKNYLFWIALGFFVALPVGYWLMNRWLQEFAYHIQVSWLTLVEACLITLVVAILTVLYQTMRAALAKPAQALKYE